MAGKTISEKILSAKSGADARAGDVVVCKVDCALGTDGSTPMAIDYFEAMGGGRVCDPQRIVFALDHYAPAPSRATANSTTRMREFAARPRHRALGGGRGHRPSTHRGIGARRCPDSLVVGADSHAVTYGALNVFATGIGSSDLAAILIGGTNLAERAGIDSRDADRRHCREAFTRRMSRWRWRANWARTARPTRRSSFAARHWTHWISKTGWCCATWRSRWAPRTAIFPADERTSATRRGTPGLRAVARDADARYAREIALDWTRWPQVALPHQVDRVAAVGDARGTPVQMVYLGTCTGGRVRDFHEARDVLGRRRGGARSAIGGDSGIARGAGRR